MQGILTYSDLPVVTSKQPNYLLLNGRTAKLARWEQPQRRMPAANFLLCDPFLGRKKRRK